MQSLCGSDFSNFTYIEYTNHVCFLIFNNVKRIKLRQFLQMKVHWFLFFLGFFCFYIFKRDSKLIVKARFPLGEFVRATQSENKNPGT